MMNQINHYLLQRLAQKPHPLLPDVDDFDDEDQRRDLFISARSAHHLLDLAAIERDSSLDVRTWRALIKILHLEDRLGRIASWHKRVTGPDGTFDDNCVECGYDWPCDTHKMATGTFVDNP